MKSAYKHIYTCIACSFMLREIELNYYNVPEPTICGMCGGFFEKSLGLSKRSKYLKSPIYNPPG